MDGSAITCDEVIKSYYEKIKATPTTFKEKNINAFLLITIALLIAVSAYYYLIKYHAKQNSLVS